MRGLPLGSDLGSKPEPTQGDSPALGHWKPRFWHLKEGRHCRLQAAEGKPHGWLPSFRAETKFHVVSP